MGRVLGSLLALVALVALAACNTTGGGSTTSWNGTWVDTLDYRSAANTRAYLSIQLQQSGSTVSGVSTSTEYLTSPIGQYHVTVRSVVQASVDPRGKLTGTVTCVSASGDDHGTPITSCSDLTTQVSALTMDVASSSTALASMPGFAATEPAYGTFLLTQHSAPETANVSIVPTSASIAPGATLALSATSSGASNSDVFWTVTGGTLSGTGTTATYTAPSSTGIYVVTATSVVDTSAKATANINVGAVPILSVSPTTILMTANNATFTVSNTGSSTSVLDYQIASNSPYVAFSSTSGSLSGGGSNSITVSVDPTALAPGDNMTAAISVTSNGGSGSVSLSYGIGTCGTYTPQAVTTLSTTALANSTPHATPSRVPTLDPQNIIPGQIIVGYNPPTDTTPSTLHNQALRTQALQKQSIAVRNTYGLHLLAGGTGQGPDLISTPNVPATLAKLHADPRVRYAQRNLQMHLLTIPNDTYYPLNAPTFPYGQWNLRDFGLPGAWTITTGTSTRPIIIAIVDQGILSTHQDFQNSANTASKVLPGWNFATGSSDTEPATSQDHGTHVAGIAAAIGNNNQGIAGVAYNFNVKLLPATVYNSSGSGGTLYQVADAIRWAAGLSVTGVPTNTTPADVINVSLGVPGDQPALDAAATDAWNNGSLLVAAAGNWGVGTTYSSDPGIMSPANAPCVIAVGSVDDPMTASSFSDAGPQLEIAAPGGFYYPSTQSGGIISTIPPATNYGIEVGTSMASPFVAGVAALLKAHDLATATPANPTTLRQALDAGTHRTTQMTDRSSYGYGVLCADKAIGAGKICAP